MQVQGCSNDSMRLGRFARFVWWFVVHWGGLPGLSGGLWFPATNARFRRWPGACAHLKCKRTMRPRSRCATQQPPPPQVVHCRRILKWTYAIAYYTFEETVSGCPAWNELSDPKLAHLSLCWWGGNSWGCSS